jgi:sugar phosphate isomerase/epimerase
MERRSFVRTLAAGAAGCLATRAASPAASPAGAGARRFKLGITSDEVDADLEKAIAFAREFSLQWLEIRNLGSKYVTEATPDEVRKARGMLDAAGIRVSVLDTALYKCALPDTKLARPTKDDYPYAEQEGLLRRALERAEGLGTRYIRVFTFWRVERPETVFDRVVEHLARSAELARAADKVLLVENVGGANVETGAETARLLAAVPSPSLGVVWDPNNAYCAGERPFPDGYGCLDKKRVKHIHLRDARRNPATNRCEWMPVGKGEIDNLGLLRALLKEGFTGTVNLETHYQRPDRNKALASRESLEGLLALLEKV